MPSSREPKVPRHMVTGADGRERNIYDPADWPPGYRPPNPPGRPPSPNARRKVISVNINDVEDLVLRAAAKKHGKPLAQWIREAAMWVADRPGPFEEGD